MGPLILHTPQYHSPEPHPSPRPIRPAPPHSLGGLLYHQYRFATIPIPTPPPGLFGPPPPTPGGGCCTIKTRKTRKTRKTCLPPALRPAPPPGLFGPPPPTPWGGLITINTPSKPLQCVGHPRVPGAKFPLTLHNPL